MCGVPLLPLPSLPPVTHTTAPHRTPTQLNAHQFKKGAAIAAANPGVPVIVNHLGTPTLKDLTDDEGVSSALPSQLYRLSTASLPPLYRLSTASLPTVCTNAR